MEKFRLAACVSLVIIILFQKCKPNTETVEIKFPEQATIPASIRKTHEHLLAELQNLKADNDSSAQVLKDLTELLKHHFNEEEKRVLPMLGLLPGLVNDKFPKDNKEMVALTDQLRNQIRHTEIEHQLIKAYLDQMVHFANGKDDLLLVFEKEVKEHASAEEEVFFPAVILAADYLKLKFRLDSMNRRR